MKPECSILEPLYASYLEALLSGDRHACRTVVESLIRDGIDLRVLYLGFFQRSLYTVGEMWERNQLSVAREHMATAITESLLPLAYPLLFSAPHSGFRALVACTANEFHQLGGKMVADILELNGWHAYFLGANTPMVDLMAMIAEKKPDLLCFSLSVYSGLPGLLSIVEAVRNEYLLLPVIAGGQAFMWGGVDRVTAYPRVRHVGTLAELERLLREW